MGERDVGEIVKDSEGFRMNYGREEIRDQVRYGGEEVIGEDVDMINGVKEMENYWNVS